ncbi:flavin reductase (NADPH)-like [Antedon mediterranea]|uniref:flavin reductase (NADPH)-like n=1 Tax=Antedon mediterranea TaxID=105859 RepID=UPI003AF711A0
MKLAVLGATGPTGVLLTQLAIERGHTVVVPVRSPQKVQLQHERLNVAEGDIYNQDFLVEQFSGCDAVLSCLGTKPTLFSKITFYEDTMKIVVSAMRTVGVKRLVAITSWCTSYNSEDPGPFFVEWILKPFVLGRVLTSMADMEDFLQKECSDLDYTTVRPPGLKTAPPTENEIKVEERQFVEGASSMINRGDVAQFMLDILETEKWYKKCIAVAY